MHRASIEEVVAGVQHHWASALATSTIDLVMKAITEEARVQAGQGGAHDELNVEELDGICLQVTDQERKSVYDKGPRLEDFGLHFVTMK